MLEPTRKNVVTLDFETYYDNEFTLSGRNLNMSEYIRDERFAIHGVGIKMGDGPTKWYTGADVAKAIKRIKWEKTALLCHNTAFDGFILHHHFDVHPALYLDTLSMARAAHGHHTRLDLDTLAKLHNRPGKTKRAALADTKGKRELTPEESAALGAYCVDDVDDTAYIFWDLYNYIPDDEIKLIDNTLRMFCDPVLKLDVQLVEEELAREVGSKTAALMLTGATPEHLLSNDKFAKLLKEHVKFLPMKVSPTTGKPAYAFAKSDDGLRLLLEHENPKVRELVNARIKIKSTIGETRATRFLEAGRDGMPFPILLNYCGAHTTRWSGGNKLNLQNLPRGGALRRSLLAPEGYAVVVADSSQIEARTNAWLAGQNDVVEAFRQKRDLYSEFASEIYGRPIDRNRKVIDADGNVTKPDFEEGFVGKVCILALGYGMGHLKLRDTLRKSDMAIDLGDARCKLAVTKYRNLNNKIVDQWRSMDEVITRMVLGESGTYRCLEYGKNFIRLPSGLFLHYYGISGTAAPDRYGQVRIQDATYLGRNGSRPKIYGGLLTENVVQALARCVIGEQMNTIAERYRIVTMTHDEIVAIAPISEANEALSFMLDVMSTPPEWAEGLPLAAEGGWDVNYSK